MLTLIDPAPEDCGKCGLYAKVEPLLKIGAWEWDIHAGKMLWSPGVYDLFELPRGSQLDLRKIVDTYKALCLGSVERLSNEILKTGESLTIETEYMTFPIIFAGCV